MLLKEFRVIYGDTYMGEIVSEVFMVDDSYSRFLIVDSDDRFMWVPIDTCKIYRE